MGFHSRFESGNRKDAVLRNTEQDVVALEWEWEEAWGNEIKKLKNHSHIFPKTKEGLKYAVLITYTYSDKLRMEEVYKRVKEKWSDAQWPLLLILIDFVKARSKQFSSRREFKNIKMSVFDKGEPRILRSAAAYPWIVPII